MFFKYFLFIILSFSLLMSTSCGDKGGETKSRPPAERDGYPPVTNPQPGDPDSCQSELVSNDECFYSLPTLGNNETFEGHYKDTSGTSTPGITLGKGVWQCIRGTWYTVQSPVCLVCLPGHSLQHCQNELESLIP